MLNIWVGNLGKYNEGELKGGWLELPKEKEEIDKFLKEVVGLNDEYEEYMINDFETDLPYKVNEYESIKMLNLLAKVSENIYNMEAIEGYANSEGDLSIEELMNIIIQEDELPYYSYQIDSWTMSAEEKYGYIMKEDAGRGYRRVVASPKPAEIVEIGAIRSLVDSGQLVIACGGGGIPVTRQGNHLKGASAVIDKDFASELLAENLNADFLIILTAVEKVAINFGKPEEKWLDDLETEEARKYIKEGHFAPGSMLPKVQAAVKFAESKPGRTALITLLEKAKDGIQGKTGTHIHLA